MLLSHCLPSMLRSAPTTPCAHHKSAFSLTGQSSYVVPACMQACLEAMAPAGLGPEGTAASSLWRAAELVVQAVCNIPAPLRPALAGAVLLQPFKQVRGAAHLLGGKSLRRAGDGAAHPLGVNSLRRAGCKTGSMSLPLCMRLATASLRRKRSSRGKNCCVGVLLGALPWPPCCTQLHHSCCVVPCMQPQHPCCYCCRWQGVQHLLRSC